MKTSLSILFLAWFTAACTPAVQQGPLAHPITEAEVVAAQNAWCGALLAIGAAYAEGGQAAAKAVAEAVIDEAYAYDQGGVLFKPTLTTNPQTFRLTRAGALSYFVGGDPAFPHDHGFALKGWTQCQPENAGIIISGSVGSSMGKVHFTGQDGSVTSVDKTWSFVKDEGGKVRIVVHHSSLEVAPE